MAAFGIVGIVFSDSAPALPALLWGPDAFDEDNRECCGFIIMPARPHTWRVTDHGTFMFENTVLGFGPFDRTSHYPCLSMLIHFSSWPVQLLADAAQARAQRPDVTACASLRLLHTWLGPDQPGQPFAPAFVSCQSVLRLAIHMFSACHRFCALFIVVACHLLIDVTSNMCHQTKTTNGGPRKVVDERVEVEGWECVHPSNCV